MESLFIQIMYKSQFLIYFFFKKLTLVTGFVVHGHILRWKVSGKFKG